MSLSTSNSEVTVPKANRPGDLLGDELVICPSNEDINPKRWAARRRRLYFVLAWLPPLLVGLVWQWGAKSGAIDERFFPAPTEIFSATTELISNGELLEHVQATVYRIGYGYPIGAALGIAVGILFGRSSWLRAMFEPSLSAAYTVPKLGIFPLLLLIFGIGETPKIVLVGASTFLMVTIGTMAATASVPSAFLDVGSVFKASRRARFFEIILPAALPQIFVSLRLAIGLSVLVVIATEFINASEGVGFLIWNSWQLFQPAPMYVGIVTSAVLGVAGAMLMSLLERLSMPWLRNQRGGSKNRPML